DAAGGEAVDDGHVVGDALGAKLLQHDEIDRVATRHVAPEQRAAGLDKPIEGAAPPGVFRLPGAPRSAVFADRGYIGAISIPTENAALMHRMEGIDPDHSPRQ